MEAKQLFYTLVSLYLVCNILQIVNRYRGASRGNVITTCKKQDFAKHFTPLQVTNNPNFNGSIDADAFQDILHNYWQQINLFNNGGEPNISKTDNDLTNIEACETLVKKQQSQLSEDKTMMESIDIKTHCKMVRRMARRVETSVAFCADPELKMDEKSLLAVYRIDSEHHISWCKIGKAASSYTLSYLLELNGRNTSIYNGPTGIHAAGRRLYARNPIKYNRLKKSLKFTTVRHPLNRLISTYCNKVVQDNLYERRGYTQTMLSFRRKTITDVLYEPLKEYSILNNVKLEHIFENLEHTQFESKEIRTYQHENKQTIYNNMSKSYDMDTKNSSHQSRYNDSNEGNKQDLAVLPTFQEFIWFVLKIFLSCRGKKDCISNTLDNHLMPQVMLCTPCPKNFDLILKVETFMNDFNFLRNLIKLPNLDEKIEQNLKIREKRRRRVTGGNMKTHKFRINVSADRCSPYKELLAQLSQVEVDLIYEVYRHDFEVFGYDILPML